MDKNKNNKKQVVVKKIPLYDLLSVLEQLYNSGADYADFHAVIDRDNMQDEITVAVLPEYINKDVRDTIKGLKEEVDDLEEENLSDEDIRDIINGGAF